MEVKCISVDNYTILKKCILQKENNPSFCKCGYSVRDGFLHPSLLYQNKLNSFSSKKEKKKHEEILDIEQTKNTKELQETQEDSSNLQLI